MDRQRKIALFGGTFDPVHRGHLHMAEAAHDALQLDEVRLIPCQISPHKFDQKPASGRERYKMLQLATQGLSWAAVDDCELQKMGPSFSYQTAESMAERFPGDRLFWLMGGDQWAALPRWEKPERLAELVEFIVITRGEAPQPRNGYRLHVINGEHPASSTLLRKRISQRALGHPWLDPAVAEYIERHRLYLD